MAPTAKDQGRAEDFEPKITLPKLQFPNGDKAPDNSVEGRRCWCSRRKAQNFEQTLVVLRHSERLDYVDKHYWKSEQGQAWPHDAPLTERGHELAAEVAEELAVLHEKAKFTAIASSPYRRCLETAAPVAKRLSLPVVIDREIGEVRDKSMPQDGPAHRSPKELMEMARSLGITILNPPMEDGDGIKLFGRTPEWPETLKAAKDRYVVRIETYIRECRERQQNMILLTHADAVAAVLVMFERGGADIQNMGFCARVVAQRSIGPKAASDPEFGVYAEHWEVDYKGLGAEIMHDAAFARYHEKMYLETCADVETNFHARRSARTKTDKMFSKALRDLTSTPEDEAEDDQV